MKGRVNLSFLGVAAATTIALVRAQTPSEVRPEFEVASIKPTKVLGGTTFGVGNGGTSGHNVTLKMIIALAYRVQEFQITGGPGWIGSDRFDIEAKAANRSANPDQLRQMLQSLLADRFKLNLHREMKQSSVYALVVGKDGPKIKLSPDQTSLDVNGPSAPGGGPNHGAMRFGAGSLIGNAVTLPLFTRALSQRLDRAVIDKTNLTGRFDIQLQWTPDVGENPLSPGGDPLPSVAPDASRPSIFVAVQEQLGLKLETTRAPIEVFVVDHVEKPSAN